MLDLFVILILFLIVLDVVVNILVLVITNLFINILERVLESRTTIFVLLMLDVLSVVSSLCLQLKMQSLICITLFKSTFR